MSVAGFHNPLHNQLHSPRHMCCGDVTIKVIWFYIKKKRLLFWRVAVNTFYISVCIWYEDNFTQIKWSNAHEVTLRAVLEMLFVCLSSLRLEIDQYIGLPIFFPIFKHFTIIRYRFWKKTITDSMCHIHNFTEYTQQWNVFSAINPSKCTHTWSSVHSGNASARPPHVTLYKIHLFVTH